MTSDPTSPILCASLESLTDASPSLEASNIIFLDCEGVNLGRAGGLLSLISLRTAERNEAPSQTFLIDVISLEKEHLRPIFDILASSSVVKVVFDGRMDYSALHHGFNVDMGNVLDLQLADVTSRETRGEGQDEQFERLCGYIRRGELSSNPKWYEKIHRLDGLEFCAREHGVIPDEAKSVSYRSHFLLDMFHLTWDKRPLSSEKLEYAARDVEIIQGLYLKFIQEELIAKEALLVQTARYLSLLHDMQPAADDDVGFSHPLLPLYILQKPYGFVQQCLSCRRDLPQDAFSKTAWRMPEKRRCWVCNAVRKVNLRKEQIRRAIEEEEEREQEEAGNEEDYY